MLQDNDLAILCPVDIEVAELAQHLVVHVGQDKPAASKLWSMVHQRRIAASPAASYRTPSSVVLSTALPIFYFRSYFASAVLVDCPRPIGGGGDLRGTLDAPTTEASMRLLLALPLTFAFGALDLWAAIPIGLVLGLSPVLSGVAAAAGGLLGAALVTIAGERLQRWLYRLQ